MPPTRRALYLLIALAACTGPAAAAPGQPGSPERQRWCAARLADCLANGPPPGLLGGPRRYCGENGDRSNCAAVCEALWGRKSDCLTRAAAATGGLALCKGYWSVKFTPRGFINGRSIC